MLSSEHSLLHGHRKGHYGVHLIIILAFLVIPSAITISMLATEHAAADRIMPWSTATVGWGPWKGDFRFALTQWSLCGRSGQQSCTAMKYDDPQFIKEGDDIQSAGNTIMWLLGVSTILLGISAIFTILGMFNGETTDRTMKALSWIMSLVATILLFASATVWSSKINDKLENYTNPHFSWGFALAIVAGCFAALATVVECLRPVTDEWAHCRC